MRRPSNLKLIISVLVLAAVLSLGLLPAGALAQVRESRQSVNLAIAVPEDVPVGNVGRIVATLENAVGEPIIGARIVFSSPAMFAGAVGEMELAQGLTDEAGTTFLDYQMRIEGENQIVARYFGDEGHEPAEVAALIMATSGSQVVTRTVGVEVPLFGAWTIIVLIGSVWSVYFAALLVVAGIPGKGRVRP